MLIFERVFGRGRYRMVGNYDWSQNHAARAADGLDATEMNNSSGGKQPHQRATSYPIAQRPDGSNIARSITCCKDCPTCLAEFNACADKHSFQSIGRKGLVQVLKERGLYHDRMLQKDMVLKLQECDDFSTKSLCERAYVTEMMAARGHVALFGVKYHAELAHIERKWMRLKQKIRPRLDSKLGTLMRLLRKAWGEMRVLDVFKAARHCRETAHAYEVLGSFELTLDALQEEKVVQKCHRKVIDSNDGKLKSKANIPLTDEQQRILNRTETRRAQTKLKSEKYNVWKAELLE